MGHRKDRFDYVKQLVRTRPVHIDIPVVTVRSDFVAVELPSARLFDCRFEFALQRDEWLEVGRSIIEVNDDGLLRRIGRLARHDWLRRS